MFGIGIFLLLSSAFPAQEPCTQQSTPARLEVPNQDAILDAAAAAAARPNSKPPGQCDSLTGAYSAFLSQIDSRPTLQHPPIVWNEFFKDFQVLDPKNQMSCVGHSVARAMALTGSAAKPSPEFLYDIGESYFQTYLSGDSLGLFNELPKEKQAEQLGRVLKRYKAAQKNVQAGGYRYARANVMLTLDYASKGVIPPREKYSKHFQGLEGFAGSRPALESIDFPSKEASFSGTALNCYASNQTGKVLKNDADFSVTGVHLKDFDFAVIDRSLEKGYFPLVTINTDKLSMSPKGDEISYLPGGRVPHVFVVVDKGTDARGPYYETLDSWADEQLKNPAVRMKKYRIYRSNLEKKVLGYSLVTRLSS